jgi:predicted secreted Zn-dependent protease
MMRRRRLPALSISAILAGWAPPVGAETVSTTRYDYYLISGRSAADLYNAMLKRGPRVDGDEAYAATSATSSQHGQLVAGKTCRMRDYRVTIDFVIRLPKLKTPASLPTADRRRFQQFMDFLRQHEETHRAIWLQCAAELEARAARLGAKSCSALEARSEKLWTDVRRTCSLRHQAFDAKEQKRLLQQPFLKSIFGRNSRSTQAAKAP